MFPGQAILLLCALGASHDLDTTPLRSAPPQVDKLTLAQLEAAAIRGEADAARELGDRYFQGYGGAPKDEIKGVHWYRKAADQGHVMAMADMGYCTLNGFGGLAKDEARALTLFLAAAKQNNAYAARMLGQMFEEGQGTPKDDAQAAEWYRRAANLDDVDALMSLAWLTESGRGVPKDEWEAARMYAIGVSKGNAIGMNNLGWFYVTGKAGLTKNYQTARELFEIAAVKGNPRADGNLGYLYENGLGTPVDLIASISHYMGAAKEGDLLSQQRLGHIYETGHPVPRDLDQALRFYLQAAAQGDEFAFQGLTRLLLGPAVPATVEVSTLVPICREQVGRGRDGARIPLALGLLRGVGITAQPEEAKRHLLAATRNQPPSQLLPYIARQIQSGSMLPQDPAFGRLLLEAVAEQGVPGAKVELARSLLDGSRELQPKGLALLKELSQANDGKACFELGLLYQNGRGVPASPSRALALFTKAAEAGLPEAMFHLGLIHQAGIGVPVNARKAREWYLKAEAAGWPPAKGRVQPDGKLAPLSTLTAPTPIR
ncbi:SEL1-like repeat protein [Geothrix sp. PMB-07]|uniref:SEL1-like repeat protein n=1 Tax=Geothrix sp. PMB-07 TaxID=3068640 RepID=UPI0027421747|nr:SEL1-like repeat protein [Geothrix sp. PMB-07]WLT31428.1 SEL1-like repeat protein [Geothrix sp. PMB-07]